MRTGLQLRQSQQLAMTPQLQQAIRLLQLSSQELDLELRRALEENVLLETPDESPSSTTEEALRDPGEDDGNDRETDPAVETDWDQTGSVESADEWSAGSAGAPDTPAPAPALSLHEHLDWQLSLTSLSDTDRAIAMVLIDALDDDGYLTEDADDICRTLRPEIEAEPDEVEAVRRRIQQFDPPGIASRTLRECLDVQLRQLDPATPGLALARKLITDHLEALGTRDTRALCNRLGADPGDFAQALHLVRSLDPRPGARISNATPTYIVPDVLVRQRGGRWLVELNADALPRVRLNETYARDTAAHRHEGLRAQLTEARWLLRSLELRNSTLLKVATAIVERQRDFLAHGEEHMHPMVLRDIAEAAELHESTVSRVTTHKYMHTPRGIYELKYFFSSQLGTDRDEGRSSTAVQAMIRRMIGGENPQKPLSDSRIARELTTRGVRVARRTVAKYRESMAIPPSHERRQSAAGP